MQKSQSKYKKKEPMTDIRHNKKESLLYINICYNLMKGHNYIQNFLFLIKSNKKLLRVGWFSFIIRYARRNRLEYFT